MYSIVVVLSSRQWKPSDAMKRELIVPFQISFGIADQI